MSTLYSASDSLRLHVPVLESNDVVVIGLNSLPGEVEELLEVLAAEAAPLAHWFDFAKAYLSQGREEHFKHICLEAVKDEVTEEVTRFFGEPPTYEQTQFHCALAALYLAKGSEDKDPTRKAEHFSSAAKHIQAARVMNPEEQMVSMAQGMLHLAKGEMPQARQEFTRACSQQNNGKPNAIGLLALAGLFFKQQQYKDALLLYRRALAQNPACPAEVRLGIAACLFRLGDMAGAGAAYERVLALDPNNADALMGLAVIKFSAPNMQQGLSDGLRLLVRAYQLDPGNVGTLILLAHYCLLRGEYQKVVTLSRAALEGADSTGVKAEAHCMLARAAHAQGQWQLASQHYTSAVSLEPGSALAHYGLAQLYVKQDAALNASTELELALKAQPTMLDALKILGQLIGDDPGKVSKALGHMKAAAGRAEEDADVWELLAELSATAGDHAGSLAAYKKVLAIHRHKQQAAQQHAEQQQQAAGSLFGGDDPPAAPTYTTPARVLNNTAVLFYRSGDLAQAMSLLQEAQAAGGPGAGAEQLSGPHRTVLAYNTARLQEASGMLRAAEDKYKALLAEEPSYIDCMLRLACLSRTKGAHHEALRWAEQANQLQAANPDALAICAQLYMERRDWTEAAAYIKKLMACTKVEEPAAADPAQPLAGGTRGDGYAQLAYGNLLLASAPGERKRPEDLSKAQLCLFKALESFRAVLKMEPRNAFAANGVGAVLAELGQLQEAQEVFGDVQAAVAASNGFLNIPDVYINLANVALAKQEHITAQRLYKVAMDKLGDTKKSLVLLYLARAYYDSDDLPAAKACLLRAIHIAPTDYKLRFNAALTMQEYAVRTFRKKRPPADPTRLAEFSRARAELVCACRYFEHLASLGKGRSGLDDRKLDTHVKFCREQAKKAAAYLDAAKQEHAVLTARREQQEVARSIEAQQKALEARKRAELDKAAQEAKEAEARRALDKQERLKEEWRLQRGEQEAAEGAADGERKKKKGKGEKKKKGKGAKGMAGDEEEPSAEGEDEGAPGASQEPGAKADAKEVDDLFGDDDDDEDADPAQMEKELMAQAGLGSDDEGPEPASGGRLKRARPIGAGGEEDGGAAADGAGGQEEDALDDDFLRDFEHEEDPVAGDEAPEFEDGEPTAKRQRRGAALADSDEEGMDS